jgi:hypothetical protein
MRAAAPEGVLFHHLPLAGSNLPIVPLPLPVVHPCRSCPRAGRADDARRAVHLEALRFRIEAGDLLPDITVM